MRELLPIQRSILLSDEITVMPITCFNFLEQICSLLDDQWLMTQENCLFSFKDPCAIQIETDVRGDLNQSWFGMRLRRLNAHLVLTFLHP